MFPSWRRFILQQANQTDGAPDKQVNGPSDQTQHGKSVGRCNKGKTGKTIISLVNWAKGDEDGW